MKRLTLTVAAAALAAAPALAGGLDEPVMEPAVVAPVAPVAAPRANGDWEGFYAGAELGYGHFKAENVKPKGAALGIQLGYRWDLGTTVLGLEGEYLDGSIDKHDAGLGGKVKAKNIYRVKGMAGYDLGDWLPYVTAGYTHMKLKTPVGSNSDDGWVLGVGVDYAIDENWRVGGEILYNDFHNFDKQGYNADGTTATVRVNYRF